MPTAYEIDQGAGLVRSRAWGKLTSQESADHYRRLAGEADFAPGFRQLCDLRGVTDLVMTSDAIRSLALTRTFAAGARRAFVTTEDAHYGMARMLQAFCEIEGSEIGVFRTMAEAEEWLGLPSGTGAFEREPAAGERADS